MGKRFLFFQLILLGPATSAVIRCAVLSLALVLGIAAQTPPERRPAPKSQSAGPAVVAAPRHTGSPFMTVWRPDDYDAQPENHCVVQQPDTGVIYVGNGGGVLEFDGARWRLIPAPGGPAVNALGVDKSGRVWGVTSGAIFRLEPDARGQMQARSMNQRLPADFGAPSFAARCVVTADGVWFFNTKKLISFGLDDTAPRVWTVAEGTAIAIRLWAIGDVPHVMLGGNVTWRLRAGRLEPVPGLTTTVMSARPEPDGSWRLLNVGAVDRWDGKKLTTISRLPAGDGANKAVFLSDGRSVFGTGRHGLVVCDRDGRIIQMIGRERGLPANQVTDVREDREGGVWATTPNGLARVQLDSPYALHGPAQGLEGTVISLTRHGERLFTGGTEGVAERRPDGRFQLVPDVPTIVREVVAHGDWVFVLTSRFRGLRPGRDSLAGQLENRNYFGLLPLAGQPGWYVFGCNEGVRWARFEGEKWIVPGPQLAATKGRAVALLEAPAGLVWAAHAGAAWRVDFRSGVAADAPARRFGPAEGMPAPPTAMFLLGGKIVAFAGGRLLTFEEAAERFRPEARVDGLEGFSIVRTHAADDGTIWLQGSPPANAIAQLVPAGDERWRAEPLPGEWLRHLKPSALYQETATQTLWIGGNGALISRDLTWRPSRPAVPPTAVVRRIETEKGELLAAGAAVSATATLPPLPPHQDALRISFSAATFAPDHAGRVHTEYRTRLDGLDREWSGWSRHAERDFTSLPWRAFTFRVQARDDAGRIGPESTLAFSIAPAWWATRWAWAGYGALSLFSVAGIVRLRTRALHRRAELLERIVADRTQELAQSNAQLATQNTELARLNQLELDEKIAAQLSEEKARLELLRYQLNPHFLLNAFTTLRGLVFSSPEAAGKTVERLADFCRLALTRSEETGASVDDEVRLIESYLDTEKARWRDELHVEMHVDPAARPVSLPPFLLQPLVENAIKYGGRTTPGALHLRVSIRRDETASRSTRPEDAALQIEIANTGEWVEAGSPHRKGSTGIGMENLRQRLRRRYRDGHELHTEARDGWVFVRLKLIPTA